jgi:hypothetical protein
LLVVGWWLLVGGCWLMVGGCWLVVVGWWLLVVGCCCQLINKHSLTATNYRATRLIFEKIPGLTHLMLEIGFLCYSLVQHG